MTLNQRLNYILLPVISLVFATAGLFAYQSLLEFEREKAAERVAREMRQFQQSIALELRSVHATLRDILNSAEMNLFLNARNPEFRALALESQLYRKLDDVREFVPGVRLLQVLDGDAVVRVSAGNRDPFAADQLSLPSSIAAESLFSSAQHTFPTTMSFYLGDQQALNVTILQAFSPEQILSERRQPGNALFVAVIEAQLQSGKRLQEQLSALKPWVSYLIVAGHAEPYRSASERLIQIENFADGQIRVSYQLPGLQLSAYLHPDYVLQQTATAKWVIALSIVALILSCFLLLRTLIYSQILRPIDRLVARVQQSSMEDSPLTRDDDDNEIARLNNAYLQLLEDTRRLATSDHLTGLSNRMSFNLLIERSLLRARQQSQQIALLYIDLDNFKRTNDLHGHQVGDQLLKQVANKLQSAVRPTDRTTRVSEEWTARLAGDEFAMLLTAIEGPEDVELVACRILGCFEHGFEMDGVVHPVQASIGIAIAPHDGHSAEQLLKHADAAMYQAKSRGKNRYQFFDRELAAQLAERRQIEHQLASAIERGEFELVFMPLFELKGLTVCGAEVLLRCPSLIEKGIGPDKFIPVAESTGQIKAIDLWVLRNAMQAQRRLQTEHDFSGTIAINISAVELHNEQFPAQVESLLKSLEIDASKIELEITETSLVSEDKLSGDTLNRLKALGLRLSLDDFGTGYTAFNQLASYPVDTLKIDRSFISTLQSDSGQQKRPMVNIILSLAQLYELEVVAEGVETAEQLAYLRDTGCTYVQGYLLSKPLNWETFVKTVCNPATVQVDLPTPNN